MDSGLVRSYRCSRPGMTAVVEARALSDKREAFARGMTAAGGGRASENDERTKKSSSRRLDNIPNRIIYLHRPVHEGRFSRASCEVEQDAVSCARAPQAQPGRPGVTVRPYYGGLPLMPAGRGTGKGRGNPERAASPEERSPSHKPRDGAPRGVTAASVSGASGHTLRTNYQGAPCGAPSPLLASRGKLKAPPAHQARGRRRVLA
jgi:hypothetical protein